MKTNLTELVFILDRSGSMGGKDIQADYKKRKNKKSPIGFILSGF
jgi:hypothetical protein